MCNLVAARDDMLGHFFVEPLVLWRSPEGPQVLVHVGVAPLVLPDVDKLVVFAKDDLKVTHRPPGQRRLFRQELGQGPVSPLVVVCVVRLHVVGLEHDQALCGPPTQQASFFNNLILWGKSFLGPFSVG